LFAVSESGVGTDVGESTLSSEHASASAVTLRMHCLRVHRHKETGASATMSLVDNTTRSTDSSIRIQQPTDGDSAAVDLCGKKGLQRTFCMRFSLTSVL